MRFRLPDTSNPFQIIKVLTQIPALSDTFPESLNTLVFSVMDRLGGCNDEKKINEQVTYR